MVDVQKFRDEEEQGYTINIVGRSAAVTEPMKNYLWSKLARIERFNEHIMHLTAWMDIQRAEHSVAILLKIEHVEVKVSAVSSDMYASIDEAVERLRRKVAHWRSRIQEHHRRHLDLTTVDMRVNVLRRPPYDEVQDYNREIEEASKKKLETSFPKIVDSETMPLKNLTPQEAIMKMELSENPFLIYRDEIDRKIKVIYRLPDGNYGVVQPE